jgi:hypothetical protein
MQQETPKQAILTQLPATHMKRAPRDEDVMNVDEGSSVSSAGLTNTSDKEM